MRQIVLTTLVAGDLWVPDAGFADPLDVDGGWWSIAEQCRAAPIDPDLPEDRRVRFPRLDRVLEDLRDDPSVSDDIEFVVLMVRHEPPRVTDTVPLEPLIERWAEVNGVQVRPVVSPPDVASDLTVIRDSLQHLGTLSDPAAVALAVPADSEVVHLVHAIEVLDALPFLSRIEVAEAAVGQQHPHSSRREVPTMLARRLLASLVADRLQDYEFIAARAIVAQVPDLLSADGQQLLDAAARYCQRNAGPLQNLGPWVLDDRQGEPFGPVGPARHLHDTRRVIHALDLAERLWLLDRDEEDVAWFLCVALIELLPGAWLESLAAEVDLGWPGGLPGRDLAARLFEHAAAEPAGDFMSVGMRTLQLLGWQIQERDHLALPRAALAALLPTPIRSRSGATVLVGDSPIRSALHDLPEVLARAQLAATTWLAFSTELRLLRNRLAHDLLDLDRASLQVALESALVAVTAEVARMRPEASQAAAWGGSAHALVRAVATGTPPVPNEELQSRADSKGGGAGIARRLLRLRSGGMLDHEDRRMIVEAAGSLDASDTIRAQILGEISRYLPDALGRRIQEAIRSALHDARLAPVGSFRAFDDLADLLTQPDLLIPGEPFDPADPGDLSGPRRLLGACLPEVTARPNALRVCRALLLSDLDR